MEKFSDVKAFRAYRMNLDATEENMAPGETREAYNMFEDNNDGKITNMKGFVNVMSLPINSDFTMPSGEFKCIGTTRDIEGNSIIYFLCSINGDDYHSILEMDTDTKALTWILKSEPLLNFQPNYKVRANVIEGLLYWTDGYFSSFLQNRFNPPRKINIAKAKAYTAAYPARWQFSQVGEAYALTGVIGFKGRKYTAYVGSSLPPLGLNNIVAWAMDSVTPEYRNKSISGYCTKVFMIHGSQYIIITDRPWVEATDSPITVSGYILPYSPGMYFGIDWQVMDRVKHPPAFAPTASYDSDLFVRSNNIRNDLFQFAYRWIYDDHEKSVFSPKSEVQYPTVVSLINGTYQNNISLDNNLVVWENTGPMEVIAVELAVRKGNVGNWTIVNRKNKYDQDNSVILASDIYARYAFFNTEVNESIDQIDVERPYDAVPLISSQQEIIEKNRILDADYHEGFDHIDIDVNLTSAQTSPNVGTIENTFDEWAAFRISGVGSPSGNYIYYAGLIDLSNFWETGYTYVISIETDPPHQYLDIEGTGSPAGYERYQNKWIKAQAVVDAPIGQSFDDFSNAVCASLRNGNYIDQSVIGINSDEFSGLGLIQTFIFLGGGVFPPKDGKFIGFIIEQTWNPEVNDHPCEYCKNVNILITRFAGSLVETTFKSGCVHSFGLFYMGRASRYGSVNISNGEKTVENSSKIYILSQSEYGNDHQLYKNKINWKINHIPPAWATHYAWAYPKNSSISYSLYATISYISTAYATNSVFISVNKYITDQHQVQTKFNIPVYEWEKGDRVRVIAKLKNLEYHTYSDYLDFEILGTMEAKDTGGGYTYVKNDINEYVLDSNGNKIKDNSQIGIVVEYFNYLDYDVDIDDTVIEIYRPKKSSDLAVYYEFGEVLPIKAPHTALRAHGGGYLGVDQVVNNGLSITPATGTFKDGDSFIKYRLIRNLFPCESFSYSDYFNSDVISIGTINAVNPNSYFAYYISKVLFSGKLIQNTRINDLSRVDSSDSMELADKYGTINTIMEVGFTLKILQKSKPSSLYIGRAGVTQPSAGSKEILSSTKDVLGTLIVHDSDYGTVHPGSVVKNENRYYFFDFYAQAICRDAGNGIQDISETYGIKRYMREKCELFGTAGNVDVVAGFDQTNNIVFFSFIDLTTAANSFTIGFRDSGGRNEDGFTGFYQFIPDMYGTSKQVITSFKDNALWLHNSNAVARCNFYGTQFKYWVTIVTNRLPLAIKRYLGILVGSSKQLSSPNAGDIAIAETWNNPGGMKSLLKRGAFTSVQGKWVANFGKNMTTHQPNPVLWDLVDGDDLTGQSMSVRLEGEETVEHKILSVEIQGVSS